MNTLRPFVVAFWLVLPVLSAAAAPAAAERAGALGLARAPASEVAAIIDGETFMLLDARKAGLVGIQAPKPPLGRAGVTLLPLAAAAKAQRRAVAPGREPALGGGGRRYLNFAEDGRQDLTRALERRAFTLFQEAGLDSRRPRRQAAACTRLAEIL